MELAPWISSLALPMKSKIAFRPSLVCSAFCMGWFVQGNWDSHGVSDHLNRGCEMGLVGVHSPSTRLRETCGVCVQCMESKIWC